MDCAKNVGVIILSNDILDELITITYTPKTEIIVKIDGRRVDALMIQLSNDEINKLGRFPSIYVASNGLKEVIYYMVRLIDAAEKCRFRRTDDILYNKIRTLLHDKDDVTEHDIADIMVIAKKLQEIS